MALKKSIYLVFWLFFCVQLFAQDPVKVGIYNPIPRAEPRSQGGVSTKYTQKCVAQYSSENGWSKKYTVNVTFISGMRLNEATNSFDYPAYSNYAVIFWDKGEASVIKLSTFLGCSVDITQQCILNVVGDIKGQDQEETEWKICVRDYCY